ncbi:hypothetical protein CR513_34185, partial [Mucuna pruriens]
MDVVAVSDHPPGYTPRPNPGSYPYGIPYMKEKAPYDPSRNAHAEGANQPRNTIVTLQEQEPATEMWQAPIP